MYFGPYDFVQISLAYDKHFSRNVCRDFRLPMSALATVAWKSFNGKFAAKIDFPIGAFYVTIADADVGSLSLSIHYLINIWSTYWWNLNKIVLSEPYKILKCSRHFGRRFCDWNNCLMLNINSETIIFQYSKNYGTPTRVTRLKVAPNMADPISLSENLP